MSDLVTRALFTIALCAFWPLFRTRWFAFASLPSGGAENGYEQRVKGLNAACRIAQAGEMAMGFAWGSTAVGPPHIFPWGSPGSMALGVLSAGLIVLSSQVHARQLNKALGLTREPGSENVPNAASETRYRGLWLGVLGLTAALAFASLPFLLSNVSDAQVRESSPRRADLGTLVNPMDGEAWLARAWNARRNNAFETAGVFADRAENLKVSPRSTLEFRAELYAATGQCEQAEAAFVSSLRLQAEEAMNIDQPLELGAYRLPPTLIEECELSEPTAP